MTFEFLSGLWIVKVDVSKPYRAKVECVWLIGIGLSPGHGICKVGDWSRLSLISICDSIILSVWCFGGGFDNWLRFCWRWVQQLVEIIYRLYQKIVTGLKFELSVTTKLPTCLLSKTPLPSFEFRRKLAIWWNIYQDIISRINEKWKMRRYHNINFLCVTHIFCLAFWSCSMWVIQSSYLQSASNDLNKSTILTWIWWIFLMKYLSCRYLSSSPWKIDYMLQFSSTQLKNQRWSSLEIGCPNHASFISQTNLHF